MFYNIANTILDGWENKIYGFSGKKQQVYRAKENMIIMQAVDYLEASLLQGANRYPSADKHRNKEMMFNITHQLFKAANNPLSGVSEGDAFGAFWVDNNMKLIVASAIGCGAIYLNDRGADLWSYNKHPNRWASAANAQINELMWHDNKSLSKRGKYPSAGFAEGPGYFDFTFSNMLPYFQAFKNFTGGSNKRFGPYRKKVYSVVSEYLDNYYSDEEYIKLYDWYMGVKMPNGESPTIDDTWGGKVFPAIALSGLSKHAFNTPGIESELSSGMWLGTEFLSRDNLPNSESKIPENYFNINSGDLVYKIIGDSIKDGHYFHLNAENSTSVNGGKPTYALIDGNKITWGHEHDDFGGFIIGAGEDILAMDPPYFGDKNWNSGYVNNVGDHNTILVDGEGHDTDNDPESISAKTIDNEYSIFNLLWKGNGLLSDKFMVNRQVEIIKDELPIYIITDNVFNLGILSNRIATFTLNGNGNTSDTSFYFLDHTKSRAVWDYPCKKDNDNGDNYKMLLTFSTYFKGQTASSELHTNDDLPHGNFNRIYNSERAGNNLFKSDFHGVVGQYVPYNTYNSNVGTHTRVYKNFSLAPGDGVQFKSTIQVLPCSYPLDKIVKYQTNPKYTSHLLNPSSDIFALFYSNTQGEWALDTSINPLQINESAILETDAKNLYFSYSTNPEFKTGNCVSYCNFRKARMANGRLFKYHDTTYISSTKVATGFYSLIGKCKYSVYTETDTACTMSFYLADVERGINMKVLGYNFTYDTGTCIMSIDLPVGQNQFEIELTDPCLVSCFFPSTQETIHETFNFNEGITATLGHKLDIVQPHGFLNISKGSHMKICNGVYLRNRDSLVLYSGCGKDTGQLSISTCDGRSNGNPSAAMEGVGGGAKASMISVMAGRL